MANVFQILPELQGQEMIFVQNLVKDMTDSKAQMFANAYRGRRKDPQTILLCTVLGFVVVAGVQRFLLGKIGMGLLYLFTFGLCIIGTIVDLVNYEKMAFEFNQKIALEVEMMMRGIE